MATGQARRSRSRGTIAWRGPRGGGVCAWIEVGATGARSGAQAGEGARCDEGVRRQGWPPAARPRRRGLTGEPPLFHLLPEAPAIDHEFRHRALSFRYVSHAKVRADQTAATVVNPKARKRVAIVIANPEVTTTTASRDLSPDGGKCEADGMSDPNGPSGYSASDLTSPPILSELGLPRL